jgi:hypothetical protein
MLVRLMDSGVLSVKMLLADTVREGRVGSSSCPGIALLLEDKGISRSVLIVFNGLFFVRIAYSLLG